MLGDSIMHACAFALATTALLATPAFADAGGTQAGGVAYADVGITASTARYWNNCVDGIAVGAGTAVHDCGRIVGARLSRRRTATAYYYRARAYSELGMSSSASGDFRNSLTTFEQILRSDDDNALAIYGRGLSLIGLGREAEGAADIDRATTLDANVAADFARRFTF
jgi:hypothetical protein